MTAGATIRTAFCGPCFGAGDVPANNALSIRHTTRNFPNREGSKPGDGQIAAVALMDARSIAATAARGGVLTPATDLDVRYENPKYYFDQSVYQARVYDGCGRPDQQAELQFGPNIADWPAMQPLADNLLLCVASLITDPVTTTDELESPPARLRATVQPAPARAVHALPQGPGLCRQGQSGAGARTGAPGRR